MLLHELLDRAASTRLGLFIGSGPLGFSVVILAALVIPLLILVREFVRDGIVFVGRPQDRWGRLLRNLRSDLLLLVLQLLLLVLAWLAFTTPPDRLPFDPPAPGSAWLFFPAQPFYIGIAYVVHGVLALYPVQLLLGIWIAYTGIGFLQTQRAMRIINLMLLGAIVVAWEADQWPVALTVPAELFLIPSIVNLLSHISGIATNARALGHPAQRLAQIGITTACLVAIWVYHGLGQPLNLLTTLPHGADANFAAVLVYAGVISMVVAIYGYLRPPGQISRAIGQQGVQALLAPFEQGQFILVLLYAVVVEGLILFALWLAFLTPRDRLPFFGPPAPDATVLAVPMAAVYAGVAIVLHALLALLGASNLLSYWGSVILPAASRSLRNRLFVIVGYAAAVAGLVVQGWPLWLIIPVEFGVAFLLIDFISLPVRYLLASIPPRVMNSRQLFHAERGARALARFAAAGFIILSVSAVLTLDSDGSFSVLVFVAYFGGIYVTLVLVDSMVDYFVSVFKSNERSHTVLSSGRWVITVPLIAILTIAGASGLYQYIGASASLGYTVWLEAGAAAAACVLFRPLVNLALINAGAVEDLQQIGEYSVLEERLGNLIRRGGNLVQDHYPIQAPLPDASHGATPDTTERGKRRDAPNENTALVPAISGAPSVPAPGGPSAAKRLRFPAAAFFLGLALCYHFFGATLSLGNLLGGNNLALIVGLVALVAGLLQLVNNPVLAAPRWTIMLLMLVTILVVSLMVVLAADPLTSAPLALTGRDPLALLADRQFLEVTLNKGLQEFLFLLTFGQIYYLFKAVRYGAEQAPMAGQQERSEILGYRFTLEQSGDDQIDQGNAGRALAFFVRAIQLDPDDATLWRRCGYAHQRIGSYQDALQCYEEALSRAPKNTIYWNDKGVALKFLKRYDEALDAYNEALRIEPNNYFALDNKGDVLAQLGLFAEAVDAYEHAVAIHENATYWNDLGLARHNLRRYDEATQAFDQALRLQPREALTLRNKAESLIKGLQRYKDGLDVVQQGLDIDSASVRGHALRGLALQGLGRQKEAEQAFKQALRFDADATGTWGSRGDALVGLKRYQEALGAYDRALKDTPHDPDAWQGKAEALRALGRTAEAREAEQHADTVVSSEAPKARPR